MVHYTQYIRRKSRVYWLLFRIWRHWICFLILDILNHIQGYHLYMAVFIHVKLEKVTCRVYGTPYCTSNVCHTLMLQLEWMFKPNHFGRHKSHWPEFRPNMWKSNMFVFTFGTYICIFTFFAKIFCSSDELYAMNKNYDLLNVLTKTNIRRNSKEILSNVHSNIGIYCTGST